jgi:hypothetical protein
MAVSQELVWLINQIRNTPLPRERLRLLALGWRTLRGLSPTDRIAIARELGFDGAEQLVEQLARRGGASPSLLLQALESLKSADHDQISEFVRGLTDPDQRAGTADRLMDAATDWLEEEAAIAGAAEPEELGEGEPPEIEEAVIQAKPPPPPPAVEGKEPPLQVGEVKHAAVEVVEGVEESTAGHAEAAPTSDEAEAPEPTPVPEDDEEAWAPVVEEPPAPPKDRSVAPAAPDVGSVAATLAAVTPLTSRFRVLAEVVDDLEGADAKQLGAVIEFFPPGWARRRALEVLLRAGIPGELEAALELVSKLERPSDRMWALSTLAACRELNTDERDAVIAAASSPSFRRRLRLRLSL